MLSGWETLMLRSLLRLGHVKEKRGRNKAEGPPGIKEYHAHWQLQRTDLTSVKGKSSTEEQGGRKLKHQETVKLLKENSPGNGLCLSPSRDVVPHRKVESTSLPLLPFLSAPWHWFGLKALEGGPTNPATLSCGENEHLTCKQFSQMHGAQGKWVWKNFTHCSLQWLLCGVRLGPTRLGVLLCLFIFYFIFQISQLRLSKLPLSKFPGDLDKFQSP